jgi:hypothetical protein
MMKSISLNLTDVSRVDELAAEDVMFAESKSATQDDLTYQLINVTKSLQSVP